MADILENDIEGYLVRRVHNVGGEQRKVQWIGRAGAPDRRIMLPAVGRYRAIAFWVELKNPKTILTFPKNGHERQQQREHERMRAGGELVFVIGTHAQVDAMLKRLGR